MTKIKVCAISDPHANTTLLTEEADILTVSGDLTMNGSITQLRDFKSWLAIQPQKHKVVIAGNHDFCFQTNKATARAVIEDANTHYLEDSEITLEGVRIYGSPWQPWFHDWAFNLKRGPDIAAKWAHIPSGLDVLLTHGPPFGYGDQVANGDRVGCQDLLAALLVKKPKWTLFGHIHEDRGHWLLNGDQDVNLVNCNVGYRVTTKVVPNYKPFYFEIDK